MQSAVESWKLIGAGGHLILAAIVLSLLAGIIANLVAGRRYANLERELLGNPDAASPFQEPVLERIVREARQRFDQGASASEIQALVESAFLSELRGALLAERFVRSATGLLIVSSIGKLVGLVTSDTAGAAEIGQALTQGLSQALSGMAVAFVTSLFGIVAAIVMMLLNIVSNVGDRRTAAMVRIEHYLEGLSTHWARERGPRAGDGSGVAAAQLVSSVAELDGAVSRFDAALRSFGESTREFREFNLHLKDNIQRMSLSFADLSETLKDAARGIGARDRN
jgi:hypothetical protein